MADQGRYVAWFDRALRTMATSAAGGRLAAAIPVTVSELTGPDVRTVPGPFQLMGPGDVARLAPGAIVRRFPTPGASDAEETKLAHVEFAAVDLPWRYTPRMPAADRLAPWLALLVAPPGADGLSLRPDGTVRVGTAVQRTHDLAQAWQWAHVHTVGGHERARLLSPADLQPGTGYIAALVPGFTADGAPAWDGTGAVVLPVYDQWTFSTGPLGDFPDLAEKLRRADLAVLALRGGRPFGRADLRYVRRDGGGEAILPAAGALRVPVEVVPDPADTAPAVEVATDVAALLTPVVVGDRDAISAPDYPAAFTAGSVQPLQGAWVGQLTRDPRHRGAAGLGAWTAIAWQQRIADAAAIKLGDTALAAERIRSLALGVELSRSLWRRHVPTDPEQALQVLAPSLGRLPADTGGTVLAALAGVNAQLSPALFSSAARRAARPGTARTSRSAGPSRLDAIVGAAASCPDPTATGDPFVEQQPDSDPERSLTDALSEAIDDQDLAAQAVAEILAAGERQFDLLRAVLAAGLATDPDDPDYPEVRRLLHTHDVVREGADDLGLWADVPDDFAPPCRPLDVMALGRAVRAAIDPTVEVPPAARRVFATLPGVVSMRPLEVEPDLDLPLWSFLSTEAPDWMLPGVGDLAEHEVIGVETNPMFVRSLLVGANVQATAELRWRNVPLVPRSSPLRRFWQRADGTMDIRPVRFWPVDAPLGTPALSPQDSQGSEAVVVFKSPLFRRYPATVVYLYDARPPGELTPRWTAPNPAEELAPDRRVDFTFTGTIGPEVTFFGFPRPASVLAHHWVVLEEPPSGYRFYASPERATQEAHAGNHAYNRFALPVRVLIGPLL